jgi:hypothetical protein
MRTLAIALLAVSCAGSRPTPGEPRTIRRTVLCAGQRCGSSVTTFDPDGKTIHNVFDVHDNGRGPRSEVTMRLLADGTIGSFESRGHGVFGAQTHETFSLAAGSAKWESEDERGEKAVSGAAFFVPRSASDTDAFLMDALAKSGGSLPLLPGGTARMERAGDATIQLQGKPKHLVAWALTGFDFTPGFVWLDDDGTYFGEGNQQSWIGPEGADEAMMQLVPKQRELTRERDRRIAERLGHKPAAAGLALLHARVLDVEKGAWLQDQTVIIQGDRIAAVGAGLRVPDGAETIDLHGQAVLPGLWDMHQHFSDADGVLDVASGVTSGRDVGNAPELIDDYKKRFDEGTAVGPHVYRAGFIEGRGKDAAHAEITAMNEAEAKTAVEFYAKRGYEMIKIYNSIPPELVAVLAREAHARGMGVIGHIPAHMLANEAVRAGYDGIEHQNQVLLNFLGTHETDTRTLQRFTVVGENAAAFDLGSAPARDFYALLREHHTVVDPTLAIEELVFTVSKGKLPPGLEPLISRLPVQVQRAIGSIGLDFGGKEELYRRSFAKMVQSIKSLRDEGITVVAGTDAIAGITLQRELELFVQAGLSPAEAIRDATLVPAKVMKADALTGSIVAGKRADLFVVDGDPLADIRDIRKTVMTFEAGVRYPSKELYETVGVSPP